MGSLSGRQKRKETDEFVFDLFDHVTLSPPLKKLRQDNGLPTIYEERPIFNISADQPAEIELPSVQVTELPIGVPEQPSLPPADEKAIVLYKPVNPPLFPGGPVARSDDLPIIVDTRFFGGPNGLSNFLFPSRNFSPLPVLASSCAPFPITAPMSEETEQSATCPNNNLAVIPWVPPQAALPATGLEMFSSPNYSSTDFDQMRIDDGGDLEAMEEDNVIDNAIPATNSASGFSAEPWQHFGVPQPSYTPVMWSH